MTALERLTEALGTHGSSHRGDSWNCPGPLHENGDRNPSLHVKETRPGGVGVWCHKGCTAEEIMSALNMTTADLFDEDAREIARYRYVSRDGEVQFAKSRFEPKKFVIMHPEGDRWEYGLNGTERPLYRLPEVIEAISAGQEIFLPEGEKDVDRLWDEGHAATCNFDGSAGKWRPEYSEVLRGARVTVIADNDDPGIKHARDVHDALKGIAASVRILRSRTEGRGDDVSDHLLAGFTVEELIPLEAPSDLVARIRRGGCILDAPPVPPALWGEGDEILWAQGQSLIIAGHDGTGKTTLAGNLVRARLGLGDGIVLGLPVLPGKRNVLILMMDRPRQAMSSLARLFREDEREVLDERLRVWPGPPPVDLAQDTLMLRELCRLADADTCVVDSLKDAAIPLSDDAVGAGWNRARQAAIADDIELLELHHPRKPPQESYKAPELSDLYGSRWIPAGIGSAIVLHGRAGDAFIRLYHRKPVVSILGPWDVLIKQDGVMVTDDHQKNLIERVSQYRDGITAQDLAVSLYESDGKNEVERARRRLEELLGEGHVTRIGGSKGREASRYFIVRS